MKTYEGISDKEAADLLQKYGENSIDVNRKKSAIVFFAQKFTSPLIIILLFCAVLSFFLGEKLNAAIIFVMILLSAIVDFVNTYKSEKTVQKLLERVSSKCLVFRDGVKKDIEAKLIVPGDYVYLEPGDIVPADGLVIESEHFFVNQSALNGESFPEEKIANTFQDKFEIGNYGKTNQVFMGTAAISGEAVMLVKSTGANTEFGKIASKLSQTEAPTTTELDIKKFSLFIMKLTLAMVLVVFFANAFVGRNIFDAFVFSIAIAVGLTPELLPIIMTVCSSRGSIKMADKGVIVKELKAIQNLGNMTVLCTDKTGTLTDDKIALIKCLDATNEPSDETLKYAYLASHFHGGVNNPLDKAVLDFKKMSVGSFKKVVEIPFDYTRKRSSVAISGDGGFLITKGAPEGVIKICDNYKQGSRALKMSQSVRSEINKNYEQLSADGFRVIAIAVKEVGKAKPSVADEKEMSFVGFAAFLDPPKQSAKVAIDEIRGLGIDIKILTGDSDILTEKICRSLNISYKGVVNGSDLVNLTDVKLAKIVKETTIFARISPDQKQKIIHALQKLGESVGFMGDGINDSPALEAADVGISVDNAVDVAKESADVILLRKSLRVLKDGIVEGRITGENTLKYILMGISSNFGNMFSMMGASFFLPFLPMLPGQVLLNNFLYDVSQLSLPSDEVDEDSIKRPIRWNMSFIKRFMIIIGPVSSIFDFLTFFLLLYAFKLTNGAFQAGWFMESLATQVFVIYIIRTKKIPFLQSNPSKLLVYNTVVAVSVGWLIAESGIGKLFGFQSLSLPVVIAIGLTVVVYLFLSQFVKVMFYRHLRNSLYK